MFLRTPNHKSFKLLPYLSYSRVYIAYSFFVFVFFCCTPHPCCTLFNLIYGMPRGDYRRPRMESLQSYRWHCLSGQTELARPLRIDNAALFAFSVSEFFSPLYFCLLSYGLIREAAGSVSVAIDNCRNVYSYYPESKPLPFPTETPLNYLAGPKMSITNR